MDARIDREATPDVDPTPDVVPDRGLDGAPDATPDTAPDRAPPDVKVDLAADGPLDAAVDTTIDAGPEASADRGPDATVDLAPDITVSVINGGAGPVTTLAGSSLAGSADGPGTLATFDDPVNVAFSKSGDLYLADFNNGMVRRVTLAGEVSTIVDQPNFRRPFGLAVTPAGTLYVQTDINDLLLQDDLVTGTIWRVDEVLGEATVVARDLGRPRGLAAIDDATLLMADERHHVLSILDVTTGVVTPLAGARDVTGLVDGTGSDARFNHPYELAALPDGRFVVSDYGNHALRAVTRAGVVSTLTGGGGPGWVDGAASQALFYHPQGIASDAAGNIYVTQRGMGVIRRLSAAGDVTTLAGDGIMDFVDATDPLQARLYAAEGIAALFNGTLLFVADGNGGEPLPFHRVRRLALGGDVCQGIDCSSFGACEARDGAPSCACLVGYHAEGLRCIAD